MNRVPLVFPLVPARPDPPRVDSKRLETVRVSDEVTRAAALAVVREVYLEEKGWIEAVQREIPEEDLSAVDRSWLLAWCGGVPAGVVRLAYDPALDLPASLGVELDAGIDLAALASSGRFVEVGRLMIARAYRSRTEVVLSLMRAAVAEVVERGYSHLLTAVFEDDPHSPYGFHTRILGFEKIGSHRFGELACSSRRILLVLDLARAIERLRDSRTSLARKLARGLEFASVGAARAVLASGAR